MRVRFSRIPARGRRFADALAYGTSQRAIAFLHTHLVRGGSLMLWPTDRAAGPSISAYPPREGNNILDTVAGLCDNLAMENQAPNAFPKTLQQAIVYFADPDNALRFMVTLRWPNGITCPRCESDQYTFISTRRTWQCKTCKKMFTVKLGTLMEDSPIGLDKWLAAIWMIGASKNGISSYEIHRGLGITQKSAWFLMHRIRLAMQTGTFEKLGGTGSQVESDETFIGGAARFMHKNKRTQKISSKTGFVGKVAVMGLLERESGEVRLKIVESRKKHVIHQAVREDVAEGTELITDALGSYEGMDEGVNSFV